MARGAGGPSRSAGCGRIARTALGHVPARVAAHPGGRASTCTRDTGLRPGRVRSVSIPADLGGSQPGRAASHF